MDNIQIAAYGAGVNSTAMIIGLVKKGIKLNAILFSDTGAEKPATYSFIIRFNAWLRRHKQKGITTIRKHTRDGISATLEQHCHKYKQLPSIAYGYKQCSQKFKVEPQEKWMNHFSPAVRHWKKGRRIIKYLGFDASERRRIRADDNKYMHRYPLIEWEWNRDRCKKEILDTGLCLPPKSSCFFCPNMRKGEILKLPKVLQERAIAIERNAQTNLREINGLGRNYKWEDLIHADEQQMKLFDDLDLYEAPCSCSD